MGTMLKLRSQLFQQRNNWWCNLQFDPFHTKLILKQGQNLVMRLTSGQEVVDSLKSVSKLTPRFSAPSTATAAEEIYANDGATYGGVSETTTVNGQRYRHMELSSLVHYCSAIQSPLRKVSKLIVLPILGLMGMGMLSISLIKSHGQELAVSGNELSTNNRAALILAEVMIKKS